MPVVKVDQSATGNLIAAPGANKAIRITGLFLGSNTGGTDVSLGDGTTTFCTSDLTQTAGGAFVVPFDKDRDWRCALNTALALTQTGSVRVTGYVEYVVDQIG